MATAAQIQTRIDNLNAAIDAIVSRGAASYSIEGVVYTALDIEKLRRELAVQSQELARSSVRRSALVEFARPD